MGARPLHRQASLVAVVELQMTARFSLMVLVGVCFAIPGLVFGCGRDAASEGGLDMSENALSGEFFQEGLRTRALSRSGTFKTEAECSWRIPGSKGYFAGCPFDRHGDLHVLGGNLAPYGNIPVNPVVELNGFSGRATFGGVC